MTLPMIQDELGLAEAVAAGTLSLEDAESRLTEALGARAGVADARGLHRTIAAIQAVRAHARATVAAGAAEEPVTGRSTSVLTGALADEIGGGRGQVDGPGGVRPVMAGPVRTRSRRVHDGRALAVAASLVVIAGALGFAYAGSQATRPSPAPSANGLATFAATGPSVAPAAAFKAADHPEVFADANSFALTSATVGWLRTYDPTSKTTGLFRTADAGATWTQLGVAPIGPDRIVDDTTAYVRTAESLLAVTHDGGATWRAATIAAPPGTGPWYVTAPAPDVAFATFAGPDNLRDLLVYSTTDGGTTWSGPVHGTTAVLDPSSNKPQGGENGLLWMWLGKADNKPFDNRVAISADGGATWSIQPLPADATFPASSLKGPTTVRIDGDRETLAVSDGDATGIYMTTDAGLHWTPIRTWPGGAMGGAIVELRSPTTWTATTPTAFWSTIDGGQTWRETPRGAEPPVVGVTFATPDVGWAEVVCGHPSYDTQLTPPPTCGGRSTGVVLMATADGGATWKEIGQ